MINFNYFVATKVMGWEEHSSQGGKFWHDKRTGMPTVALEAWKPTESLPQAFEVVEKMRKKGYELWLNNEESFSEVPDVAKMRAWRAEFRHVDAHVVEHGEKPAQAICKAALRAVGWLDEEVLFFESSIPMERYEIKKALEAIRRDPDNYASHFDLGMVYSKRGRFFKAQEAFKTAINLKRDYAEAHAELAWVYYQLKQVSEAVEEYQEALGLKPDLKTAHFGLALSYLALGDKASALKEHKLLQALDEDLAQKLAESLHK